MQWTVRNSVSRVQNIKPLSSPCSVCPERPITRSLFSGEMRFMIDIFLPTCYTERASIFRTREKSLKSRNKGKDWKKNEFSSVEYVSVGKGKVKEEISLISFRVPCFLHSLPCSILHTYILQLLVSATWCTALYTACDSCSRRFCL